MLKNMIYDNPTRFTFEFEGFLTDLGVSYNMYSDRFVIYENGKEIKLMDLVVDRISLDDGTTNVYAVSRYTEKVIDIKLNDFSNLDEMIKFVRAKGK